MTKKRNFDILIIGTGSSGLMSAIKLSNNLSIALITKDKVLNSSSYYAQGGISAVLNKDDSFKTHIRDTLVSGGGLVDENIASFMVKNAPNAIKDLEKIGVEFSKDNNKYHLTTEGGHSKHRVAHVTDKTGQSIQVNLLKTIIEKENIIIFENHIAIDLLVKNNSCYGAYIFNKKTNSIKNFMAHKTIIATGGASKAYLYTSNPDTSTGDGIAMAYRSGCVISNMEFTQFHPTCLYHQHAKSFLISESLRGEGAKLVLANNKPFMHKYDKRMELAPRDIVARAIDNEMKTLGINCVYLDISFKKKAWIKSHFPTIYKKCLTFGIDITKVAIPVVPAAHYTCGGIQVDIHAKSNIENLYSIGETTYNGAHGANRLASNSLLECIVFATSCAQYINKQKLNKKHAKFNNWDASRVSSSKEKIVVAHLWDEIRRIMWNFVGIMRNDKRLNYAKKRLTQIQTEVNDYYRTYLISNDLIELRNIIEVSQIIVKSAINRKESRGLHYNEDHTKKLKQANNTLLKKL